MERVNKFKKGKNMLKIKKIAIALCLCLCLVFPFVFTGCGFNKDNAKLREKIASLEAQMPTNEQRLNNAYYVFDSALRMIPNPCGGMLGGYVGVYLNRINSFIESEREKGETFEMWERDNFLDNVNIGECFGRQDPNFHAFDILLIAKQYAQYKDNCIIFSVEGVDSGYAFVVDGNQYTLLYYLDDSGSNMPFVEKHQFVLTVDDDGHPITLDEYHEFSLYKSGYYGGKAISHTTHNFENTSVYGEYSATSTSACYTIDEDGQMITTAENGPACFSGTFTCNLVNNSWALQAGEGHQVRAHHYTITYGVGGASYPEVEYSLTEKDQEWAMEKLEELSAHQFPDLATYYAD